MKLIGDVVSDVARFLGFKECDACKKRKKKWNAAHQKLRGRKPPCAECAKVRRIG
jgi:hypothetical protein